MDHYFTNKPNLKSEIRTINYSYGQYDLIFLSDNGVFSKNHIDYGSELLLKSFFNNYDGNGTCLDLGCGYGFIGCTINKVKHMKVTMSDVNKRALHLTKRNVEANKVQADIIESNAYENITDKFDVIITNPPIRVGKEILLKILIGAKDHLNKDGQLWYVCRKDQGAKSIAKILNEHYQVNEVEKSKGFYIFCCKNY